MGFGESGNIVEMNAKGDERLFSPSFSFSVLLPLVFIVLGNALPIFADDYGNSGNKLLLVKAENRENALYKKTNGVNTSLVMSRIDPAFDYQLEQLKRAVREAEQVDIKASVTENSDIDKKGKPANSNQMEFCSAILTSLRNGSAKPAEPIASMILKEDQEPYFNLVSGIVKEYQKSYLPLYRDWLLSGSRSTKKDEIEKEYGEALRHIEQYWLDGDLYQEVSILNYREELMDPETPSTANYTVPLSRRALFRNGTVDGKPVYVQLIYFLWISNKEQLDFPVNAIERMEVSSLGSHYIGLDKELGLSREFSWGIDAMGVMEYEGEIVVWALHDTNPRRIPLEVHNGFNYSVMILSRKGSYGKGQGGGSRLSLTCEFNFN